MSNGTGLHLIDIVSHLVVLWGGIALFVLVGVRWLRRYRQPTYGQSLLFIAIMLCVAFVWLIIIGVLPVAAYGHLVSVGLAASLQQTVTFFWPGIGWTAGVLLILSGGRWVYTRIHQRR